MNKYIYAEAPLDYWPVIDTIIANSYEDAVEKLTERYAEQYEDDDTLANGFDTFKDLQEYMNDKYVLAIGDLVDIEYL